jgi:uncharacterized alpha-E superfamily protein
VAYNLAALERASQALRERLSSEQWGLIRTMDETFVAALRAPGQELPAWPQVLPALDRLVLQLAAVTGAQTDRMTRDHGWRLLTVGRLLERLLGVSALFKAFLESGALHTAAGFELLLDLFDSAITFRARYQHHEDLLALTDLLVLDNTNPRAFAGVLRRLRTELTKLPGGDAHTAQLLARLPAEGTGLTLEALRGADDRPSPRCCWACRAGWATPRRRWPTRSARATSRWPTAWTRWSEHGPGSRPRNALRLRCAGVAGAPPGAPAAAG